MRKIIESTLADLKQQNADEREHLFDVKIDSIDGNQVSLGGRVLAEADRLALRQVLQTRINGLTVDDSGIQSLRQSEPLLMANTTNLTGLYREPSWLAEQVNQLLYGVQVEILEKQDKWAFVRCLDGYLGWAYLAYFTPTVLPPATHLVTAPVSWLRAEPRPDAPLVTRVLGGTFIYLEGQQGEWAKIQANQTGWVHADDMRNLQSIPVSVSQRRALMVKDAFQMIGVPYLWGGVSAHGIDCSGFAQLVHRWSGMTLRRDADMQKADGKPVEPPQLQPGDLVFFGEAADKRAITHVGISLGGWDMIHSSRSRNGVYTDNIQAVNDLRESFVGAATYL